MNHSKFRTAVVAVVSVAVFNAGGISAAHSAIVDTGAMVQTSRSMSLAAIQTELARDEVRAQLDHFGVSPDAVEARLATLSDAELATLSKRMKDAPAGRGVLVLVGAAFVVLLILELVGVIDIFKRV